MGDMLLDALIDTVKLIPYLFITFLILEFLEHKLSKKSQKVLKENKKYGPILGGLLGGLPQCGFSAMAANLFSGRVITIGTIIAIFLSTSDEMLPIMISEQYAIPTMLKIVGCKILLGIVIGIIVDLIIKDKNNKNSIEEICEHDHCHCEKEGVLVSSIMHTLKTTIFVLIANIVIGVIIFEVGEDNIKNILLQNNILTYFIASLIGLVPNCASSVIITELYLSDLITMGNLMAGLLTGSGLGILLLFKNNKDMKENLTILGIIYFIGVIIGLLTDLIV